ncbi:hypothetical protein FACHB389_04610 [Nostoc calcicola FACHB-389]|nr:hypothetical protein FACHB389_04610 [Nostoc calcicola FACHB-389]
MGSGDNALRLKGKGERGKVSNTSFTPYPKTISQTTMEVHTAYPNRIGSGDAWTRGHRDAKTNDK